MAVYQNNWQIEDAKLISQTNLIYDNNLNNVISSNITFSNNENMLNDYILELDLKHEFEWDNDLITYYLSCDNCDSDTLLVPISVLI